MGKGFGDGYPTPILKPKEGEGKIHIPHNRHMAHPCMEADKIGAPAKQDCPAQNGSKKLKNMFYMGMQTVYGI